jgi:tetratricopeptide (TPR) repeat protein
LAGARDALARAMELGHADDRGLAARIGAERSGTNTGAESRASTPGASVTPTRAALLAIERGELSSAKAALDEHLAADPDDSDALALRGYVHHGQGDLAAAERDLERAATLRPDSYDALYQLGAVYRGTARPELALEKFREAAAVAKDGESRAKASIQIAELSSEAGRPQEAAAAFEAAVAANPSLEGRVAPALASLYAEIGDRANARRWAEVSTEQGLDATAQYNLGVTHFNSKEWEQAAQYFEKAVTADPALGEAHRALGFSLLNLRREREALEHLRTYLELAPAAQDAQEIRSLVDSLGP